MTGCFRIHPQDNVAVALATVKAGEVVAGGVTAREDIPAGHKAALRRIPKGEAVIKYGFPIGLASRDIELGEWVHTHCVHSALGPLLTYEWNPEIHPLTLQRPETFMGYRRPDGTVGIRNEVWIIPTVGCVNGIAKQAERMAQDLLAPGIDGITAYMHPYGCSQLGDDLKNTQKALAGLVRHPNAGAVLVLGLGCENNTMEEFRAELGPVNPERVKFLVCQDADDELAEAHELLIQLCAYAARFSREPCSASELVVGLKCGGSDGFSGITANPLLGAFSDRLVAQGGSTILTEVPEMFGAETLLMNRCPDEALFGRTVSLINDFKTYFTDHGQEIDSNPSPGNKEGGITTLEEKSLGCVQKGGTAPVSAVLSYGEPLARKGLNLLQGPGNDLVASTAEVISGAQMVLFTTGRGTPFGCPAPTLKISSNSELAHRKQNWIDFDAGPLLDGASMDALADDFFHLILRVASGETLAKSEALDRSELAIFKDGVTL